MVGLEPTISQKHTHLHAVYRGRDCFIEQHVCDPMMYFILSFLNRNWVLIQSYNVTVAFLMGFIGKS